MLTVLAGFGRHHHDAQDLVMVWQVADQQDSDTEQHRIRTNMVIMATLHLEGGHYVDCKSCSTQRLPQRHEIQHEM